MPAQKADLVKNYSPSLPASEPLYKENYWMLHSALNDVAIAIASDSLQHRTNLRRVMELAGLNVVLSEPLTRLFLRKLERSQAEVLLLDLHDEEEESESLLHEVLDNVDIPIIFNDVTALTFNEPANTKWHYSLMQKIAESKGINDWQSGEYDISDLHKVIAQKSKTQTKKDQQIARHVWVLGASLGGPEAVKRFLKTLPVDLPVAFILAQHLGANFVGLLAEQLGRSTRLRVMPPKDNHVLMAGDVIVAPVGERLLVNPIGNIELTGLEQETKYTPSIDMVIADVAARYGERSGVIIFSGMGDDGKQGCYQMLDAGGQVWLQSAESCVISSMPDHVRNAHGAHFIGNPEQLAKQLTKHFMSSEVE